MKLTPLFRLVSGLFFIAAVTLFVETRQAVIDNHKAKRNAPERAEKKSSNVSNTDYIFFESISKYFFISL